MCYACCRINHNHPLVLIKDKLLKFTEEEIVDDQLHELRYYRQTDKGHALWLDGSCNAKVHRFETA